MTVGADMDIRVRHLVRRGGGFYFQPSASMRRAGYVAEPLGSDESEAVSRAQALNAEWDTIRSGEREQSTRRPGSVKALIADWQNSSAYRRLARKTTKGYDAAATTIETKFGPFLAAAVKRSHLLTWLEDETKRVSEDHARRLYKVLRILFGRARDADLRDDNPAEKLRLPGGKPRRVLWTPEQVESFEAASEARGRPSLALVARFCFDMCQRIGDGRTFAPSAWNGRTVRIRQSKGGVLVEAPATLALRKRLLAAPKDGEALVINEATGAPYSEFEIGDQVRLTCRAAGLPDILQGRDWRKSGMVRYARLGTPLPWIVAVSGHQIETGQKILETYIPRDAGMAKSAVVKLDAALRRKAKGRTKVGK